MRRDGEEGERERPGGPGRGTGTLSELWSATPPPRPPTPPPPPSCAHLHSNDLRPTTLRIVLFNCRASKNIIPFVDKTPADIFLLSEVDIRPEALPAITLELRQRSLSYLVHRDTREMRFIILFNRRCSVSWQHITDHGIGCVFLTPTPILICGAYVPPQCRDHLSRFSTMVMSCLQRFPALPMICGGDLNVTTNRMPSPALFDITPTGPNFRGITSPSVILCDQHVRGRVHSSLLQHPALGDGHLPLQVDIEGWAVHTVSAKSLMQKWNNIAQLAAPIHRVDHVNGTDLHFDEITRYIARPHLRNWKRISSQMRQTLGLHSLPPPTDVVREHIRQWTETGKRTLPTTGQLIQKDREGRAPSWVLRQGHPTICPKCIEESYHSLWAQIWTKQQTAPYVPLHTLEKEDIDRNRATIQAPICLQEVQDMVAQTNPSKTSGDYSIRDLHAWARKATIAEWTHMTTMINGIIPTQTLTTMIPKSLETGDPRQRRPIGVLPVLFMLRRKILVRRFYTLQIQWHPRNYTFRQGRSPADIITGIHAFLRFCNWDEPVGVMGADTVKAYDTVPHNVIDSILCAYGLDTNWTVYATTSLSTRLIMARGLTRSIPITRGFLQGDPWSCPGFMLLAECACRFIDVHTISRPITFYIMVDDIQAVVLTWADATRIIDLYTRFYATLGMNVAKLRMLGNNPMKESRHPESTIPCSQHGVVFGSCIHMTRTTCPRKSEFHARCVKVLDIIRRSTPNELKRFRLVQRYVQPLISYFPDPCTDEHLLQQEIITLSARGVPNPRTPIRGIKQALHVPIEEGGKGCINVAHVRNILTYRLLSGVFLYDHPEKDIIERACMEPGASHLNLFHKIHQMFRRDTTTGYFYWTPPEPFSISSGHGESPRLVATDASVKPNHTVIGVYAEFDTGSESLTCELHPAVRDTFSAEMAGIAIGALLYPGSTIVTDSLSSVRHIHAMLLGTPSEQIRLYRRDFCGAVTATILTSRAHVVWTKAHLPYPDTRHSFMNMVADRLTHMEPDASVSINELSHTSHRGLKYVPPDCLDPSEMIARMSEAFCMTSINLRSLAFHCLPGGQFSLSDEVCNTLISLRTRALFPLRLSQSLVCTCGATLSHAIIHIATGCVHADHTRTPEWLRRRLNVWGAHLPWWRNLCLQDPCVCTNPHYTCLHIFHALSPRGYDVPTRLLRGMARYMHARLMTCYPRNLQLRYEL